jgi:hypothetical protein
MSQSNRELLSIGVLFLIIAIALGLYATGLIVDWTLIITSILFLTGIWFVFLAGLRMMKPQKYERGPFSTLSVGLLLMAFAGAWYLAGLNLLYSLILILVVIGALVIFVATRKI